ncbi:MAG: DUF5995 family protein [Myxococcales bacterium]
MERSEKQWLTDPRLDPAQRIYRLAELLESYALRYERAHDHRAVFTTAYVKLSLELASKMPHAGFSDTVWIADLGVSFAGRYLRALDAHEAGTLKSGAWATVFAALQGRRTSVLEELVLGMTAHIVNDLPHTLVEVGMTNPEGQSRIADFHRVNDVLGGAVEGVQSEVIKRYEPALGLLDSFAKDYDEILTNYGLRAARGVAWYNALRLEDPEISTGGRGGDRAQPANHTAERPEPARASTSRCVSLGPSVVTARSSMACSRVR